MSDAPSSTVRFNDGKAPDAMRTIGEVSKAFDIKAHVLRYWEQQFPMLQPLKRSGGRRLYRPADIALIETIDRLVNQEGYTLKGARRALEEPAPAASEVTQSAAPASVEPTEKQVGQPDVLPQLRSIRDRLAAALDA